jgi:tripartite-type tricarboxylate transporter receptor subunit TctC
MRTPFRRVATTIAATLLALAAAFAPAAFADDYPNKPIKVISDSAPGSAIDVMFRMVMDRLGTELGQQIVPIDRPGAGGAIAAHAASESVADGYTFFAPALSLFISLPGKAENLPLILPRDFLPVGSLAELPMFVCASVQSGIKTLPDLIARAKAQPGEISFAATGIGRLTHLTGLLLGSKTGIKLAVVPYAGGPAAALTDVIGGRVPLVIEGYSGLAGAIAAHTITALAVASTHRLPDFPDLPTVAETLPGFAAGGWQGMVAPLGTPAPAIQRINASLKKVLGDPELAKQLATRGAYVAPMSPPEVNTFINTQQEQWRPVLEAFEASVKK